LPLSFVFSGELTSSGRTEFRVDSLVNASVLYWTLVMYVDDEDGEDGVISCAPRWVNNDVHPPRRADGQLSTWRDHWMQAVYYLPPTTFVNNTITLTHDEYSFWWGGDHEQHPGCVCGVHKEVSRTRLLGVNRFDYGSVGGLFEKKDYYDTVVVLGDNSLLPLKCLEHCGNVVSVRETSGFSLKGVREFSSVADSERGGLVKGRVLILGEVYFSSAVDPVDHYNLFRRGVAEFREFFAEGLTAIDVYPENVSVVLMNVKFEDLWRIRAPVGSTCGVDITDFDEIVMKALDLVDEVEVHPVFEYAFEVVNVVKVKGNYSGEFEGGNAVVYWLDYHWGDNCEVTLPLGLQGVKFYKDNRTVRVIRKFHNDLLQLHVH
jgi:protein arginine N-methyltransferase 7